MIFGRGIPPDITGTIVPYIVLWDLISYNTKLAIRVGRMPVDRLRCAQLGSEIFVHLF